MKLADARTLLLTILTAVVLVLGGVVAHGQRPQGGGAAGPMIVDFAALWADGKPVTDLTAADLTVKIGGKVRAVSDLTLKKIGAPAAGVPAAAAAAAPPTTGPSAPFATNEPGAAPAPAPAAATGRHFLVIVDTESLAAGTEPQVKTAIEGLLKELTPADRVAFSTAPHDTAQIGFGTSLSAVRAAVANLRGQKAATSNSDDAAATALCRTSDTLNLTKALMQQAPGGETPVAMVVIAGSLSTPGTASSKASTGSTCNVQPDQYNSLAAATAGARVNMYVVQGDAGAMGRDSGLENLAGVTGAGAVMRVTNDGFAPRVLSEASTYWVATLAPDPSDKPNQSQRLDLKSVKEGVTIRTRPEVMMSHAANAAAGVPAAAGKAGATPADMAKSTASYTDLQMRAFAFAQRGAGDKMLVILQVEPTDPSVKLAAMKVGYFDAGGKGGVIDATQIITYPITVGLPLGVGPYKIRVAATDATGKAGAVDVKIDTAPIPAGPFKLSGLMLLAQNAKGENSPRLQFSSTDKVTALFELYGIVTSAPMKIGFEIAASDTGPATKTIRPSGSNTTAEPDKVQIFAEIPLTGLAPGDYVIRGLVQQEGQPEGRTIRTIRIVK